MTVIKLLTQKAHDAPHEREGICAKVLMTVIKLLTPKAFREDLR
jgi:hypothetical protein